MALTHICSAKCYSCTEKQLGPDWRDKGRAPVIRSFHLVRALFTGTPRQHPEVMDCWECQECHALVPHGSFHTYQQTGNIVVPTKRKGK